MRTSEIVIWDNGSADGTREYLRAQSDRRIRVVSHAGNIGQNAYARAFAMTQAPYLIEVDDDIVSAPEGWDATLLDAFRALPHMGYLVANLANDPHDTAVRYIRYLREQRNAYVRVVESGVVVLEGPTGGGCTMTSRYVYERVGGFKEHQRLVYWREGRRLRGTRSEGGISPRDPRGPRGCPSRRPVLLAAEPRQDSLARARTSPPGAT